MIRFAVPLLFLPAALAAGPAWLPFGQTSVAWHDNATNANLSADILDGVQLQAEVSAMRRTPLGRDDTWFTTVAAALESWPRFDGLDRAGAGARFAWQHKFGLGPFAPLIVLETAGDLVGAREAGRAGRQGLVSLTARQRLAHAWRARARHERARYDARTHAFDRTGHETTIALEYEAAPGWRFTLAAARRHGGILSYATPPRPDLLREGKALTTVATFDRSVPMVAYYFIARTESWRLEAAHSLDARRTLFLAADYRNTTRGPIGYKNRLLTAGLSQRF